MLEVSHWDSGHVINKQIVLANEFFISHSAKKVGCASRNEHPDEFLIAHWGP